MFDCVSFAFTPLSALVITLFFLHKHCTFQSSFSAGALISIAPLAPWGASLLLLLFTELPALSSASFWGGISSKKGTSQCEEDKKKKKNEKKTRAMCSNASYIDCQETGAADGWWTMHPDKHLFTLPCISSSALGSILFHWQSHSSAAFWAGRLWNI